MAIYFITEIIGTIGFAASGVLLAIKRDFDIFGIIIMSIISAIGGGFIRDIVLGITPPVMFSNPIYAITATIVALLLLIPAMRKFIHRKNVYAVTMILMDSLGLAVFTINGIIYTANIYPDNNFLLFFAGVITGVGGGVIRDILACRLPYIFTKHIYACAASAGALVYIFLKNFIDNNIASLIGVFAILVLRLISAYYKLKLPHVENFED